MKDKIVNWCKENKLVITFVLFSFLMEALSVYAVEGELIIQNPALYMGLIGLVVFIVLLIKKNILRYFVCTVFLVVQAVMDIAFVVVYDMTGQYFDFGMLYLRNDAWGILESIPMNFIAFYSELFVCSMFIIFGRRYVRRNKVVDVSKNHRIAYSLLALFCVGSLVYVTWSYNSSTKNKYVNMIDNDNDSAYTSMGIMGNLVNEVSKGLLYDKTEKLTDEEIESFIYSDVACESPYFAISKDNNVITILVESFEWFGFMQNDEYPNGLGLSKKDLKYLFPNLTKFYNESVVMNNFHSKEKTDISETLSLLGSYPTDSYVDYDFENNAMPQTAPNTLKLLSEDDIVANSFHNGYKSFYNREYTHKSFGFEKLTDCYDMMDIVDEKTKAGKKPTMVNYLEEGERNLDSEMFTTCKDLMFRKDKRFYTYITTITMHGIYYERDNLAKYREKLLKVYTPAGDNDNEENLINYMTTVMDFDNAIGIMMKDLKKKGLLDKTTIVMFGDHNSYYQQLSNYVKDIEDYGTERYYTDLYKVPFMIYDKNLEHKVIDKFTCTSDIVPTILDLLGVKYYSNMYYGNSVFSDVESPLYSRAYGFFVGDGIVCRNFNNMLYRADSVTDEYIEDFKNSSIKLVDKIKFCDQIFYNDYFADETHMATLEEKLKKIN